MSNQNKPHAIEYEFYKPSEKMPEDGGPVLIVSHHAIFVGSYEPGADLWFDESDRIFPGKEVEWWAEIFLPI